MATIFTLDDTAPAGGDAPSTIDNQIRDLKTALINTYSKSTTGNEPTSPAPVAGQLWFNTSLNVIEIYSGTAWLPLNYHLFGLKTATSLTSTDKQVNFTLNGGANMAYLSSIIGVVSVLITPNTANSFIRVLSSTSSGFTGGTVRATSPPVGTTGKKIVTIPFEVSYGDATPLTVGAVYWYINSSDGSDSFSTTLADHLLNYHIKGVSLT